MTLNADIFVLIFEHLDLDDLLGLAATCRLLNHLVHYFGWSIFLRNNQRHSLTLHPSRSRWSPLAQVRYDYLTDRAWLRARFIARPLAQQWHGKLRPAIALSTSTLLVAAGRLLYSFSVQANLDTSPSRIVTDRSYTFNPGHNVIQPDITSVAFRSDSSQDGTAFLGFADGSVHQFSLLPYQEPTESPHIEMERTPQTILHHHGANVVQSISYSSCTVLSLSQWGSVFLTNLTSDSRPSVSLNLGIRSWASYLCMSSSSSYAVFGTTSPEPLTLYDITPYGFSSTPSVVLRSAKHRPSAVYGITCPPPSSPLGPSEQIIVSGWFDGSVHIHDFRIRHHPPCSPTSTTTSSSLPTLSPVLTLRDPWAPEPIYDVSCGGGNGSFVAAGTARHSIVAFWDVRQPSRGWSVHSPGNDSSPVYSVVLESSRLFGATQSRPFVYDFGPGVTTETYPPIPTQSPVAAGRRGRRVSDDGLKPDKDGIGYQVVKYTHRRMAIF